jgi:hypothetical protein
VRAAEVGVTAQQAYDELVGELLSPGFRRLGMTGSKGRYKLACASGWALLGLQKSAYSDAAEVQFTINLMVANKQTWASVRSEKPYLPERPAPGTSYGDATAQTRIGALMPGEADIWWRVHEGVSTFEIAADVLANVEVFGVPWLRREMGVRGCA